MSSSYRPTSLRLQLELLEPRLVMSAASLLDIPLSAHVEQIAHDDDHDHLHGFDPYGNEYHAIPPVDFHRLGQHNYPDVDQPVRLEDLGRTFHLHSNPSASKTIYLDFTGHTTSGTYWNSSFNNGNDIVTGAYNFSGDESFTESELERIQNIWARVAEDFAPFDVNVTTADPLSAALSNTGGGDDQWGIRVVIGGNGSWYGSAGGVAYLRSFRWNSDTPVFVFEDNLANGHERYTAEAISHEVGHALGLSHDGTSSAGYYQGHGVGDTGWAPIMGVGYYKQLTQWSQGEYSDANNGEDDLSIITSDNGFSYRADDHGGTSGAASFLTIAQDVVSGEGIVERNTDVDVFTFNTTGGQIDLTFSEAVRGANLDMLVELYDAGGGLVVSSNPSTDLGASLNLAVAAGDYFIHVSGTGKDNPSTGYSDYGSLGQYNISGSVEGLVDVNALLVAALDVGSGSPTSPTPMTEPGQSELHVVRASSDRLGESALLQTTRPGVQQTGNHRDPTQLVPTPPLSASILIRDRQDGGFGEDHKETEAVLDGILESASELLSDMELVSRLNESPIPTV